MSLRRSQLRYRWEPLLSSEEIRDWVSAPGNRALREKLPTDPGVYRWLFPAEGSEKSRAYVGEGENLRVRITDYLKAAIQPVITAPDNSFREEHLKEAIKTIHRSAIVRIGEWLARQSSTGCVQLQRLEILEEAVIGGVEVSERLLHDEDREGLSRALGHSIDGNRRSGSHRAQSGPQCTREKTVDEASSETKDASKGASEGARL